MNYYQQPRVSEHLVKLAGFVSTRDYQNAGALTGGGIGLLLGGGIGYGLGPKDKKLLSALLGAGVGGVGGTMVGSGLGRAYGNNRQIGNLVPLLPFNPPWKPGRHQLDSEAYPGPDRSRFK